MKVILGREPNSIFFSRSRKRESAFTLVELMVVVAIIGLLVALALPPAIRSRIQANESAAIGNLRTLSSAAEAFRTTLSPPAYSPDLNGMVTSSPPYLDSSWTTNQRQGYNFAYVVAGDQSTYSASATPQTPAISGINSYCVDQTGILRRYAPGAAVGDAAGCEAGGTPI